MQLVERVVDLEAEVARLQAALAKHQIAAERARVKADIEAANPGFTWDAEKGELVPK